MTQNFFAIEDALSAFMSSAELPVHTLRLESNGGSPVLTGAVRWPVDQVMRGYVDRVERTAEACSLIGWAADPTTLQACPVMALEDGKIISVQKRTTYERPDVNQALQLPAGTRAGFVIVVPATIRAERLTVVAVAGKHVCELSVHGIQRTAVVAAAATRVDAPAALRDAIKDPLYTFPAGSPFEGVHCFREDFDPRQTAGVTSQFIEEAATYHRKYTAHDRWRTVVAQALSAAGQDPAAVRRILDIGSGSGNSVIPSLLLMPNASIVATDISPQLLAILHAQLSEADRARCLSIAFDACESRFHDNAFDLVIGAAILHHVPDPAAAIAAAVAAVRPGGHVLFFEPFAAGNAMVAQLYDELVERADELKLSPDVVRMFTAIRHDLVVRLGVAPGDPSLYNLDDKWLFSRAYFEHYRRTFSCSDMRVYSLLPMEKPLAGQVKAHLKLCLEAGPEALPPKAWSLIDRYDDRMSPAVRADVFMEAAVIITK